MRDHTYSLRRTVVAATTVAAAVASALIGSAAPASAAASFTKLQGAATTAAGLTPTVDAYRLLLGNPNNGSAPGSQAAGRREINWDGVPDTAADPNVLPRDFFNTTVPRGVVFSSSTNVFAVSADSSNPTWTPPLFGNANAQNPANFATFSPERLFTPWGTNTMSVRFFVPGTTQPAAVHGFGAVFTDVDRANTSRIQLYDRWGSLLWSDFVLPGPQATKSLSFLGVVTTADVAEVRITTGNAAIGSTDNASWDVVVMDDFLYGEPQPLL
jgi:hypothetical protein